MKYIASVTILFMLISSCGGGAEESVTYLETVAPIVGQLNAAITRAWNTPRIDLPEAIENIELNRRQIALIECPQNCGAFKSDLLSSIDSIITLLLAYQNYQDQAVLDSLSEIQENKLDTFVDSRGSLLETLELTDDDWEGFKGEAN